MSELSERFREEARRRSDRGFADGSTDGEKLCDEIDALEATIQRVNTALSNHPRTCDKHTDESPITCGWKRAVIDVQDALDGPL